MVIDLFRELDEHPVEVVPNPSSPAFFAVLPTVLKRAYSLVSIRRRSDDFSTLQRGENPCQTRFYAIGIMQDQRQSTTRVGPTS